MTLVKFKKDSDLIGDTFKSIFNNPFFPFRDEMFSNTNLVPRTRITEDKDNVYITLEMAGLSKDEIKINLEKEILTISGTKKQETHKEESNLIMNEIQYGEFARSFNITNDINVEAIKADFKDGVLSLTLPKREESKPVVKEIKIG
ncbi:MAG TPA: Hsp20/alpha crystallin family protein [Ignavibacteria bacterium]|nr:Hsp20/alpha crystallin family protein [Ignavibacteria bacterium]